MSLLNSNELMQVGAMETKTWLFAIISIFTLCISTAAFAGSSPSLTGIADIEVNRNSNALDREIDLYRYANDDRSVSELNFDIVSQSNSRLINCFIENDRYLSCDEPSSDDFGSSTIRIEAVDREGNSASDSFVVRVLDSGSSGTSRSDDAPSIFGLPDVTIRENSGYRSNLVDLYRYANDDEDSDSELDYRIISQSNRNLINCLIAGDRYLECEAPRNNSTGTSTVRLEVEDTAGHTDDDLMTIEVVSDGSGNCSDITVNTKTIYMDEDDTQRVTFDIRNRSNSDFKIRDIQVSDDSQYLLTRNIDFGSRINSEDTENLDMELESLNTTSERDATVTIEVRGEFDNGDVCSFSDIGSNSFRVHIRGNTGSSSAASGSTCGDVEVRASDVSVRENGTTTKQFTLVNNNTRNFYVNSVRLDESSPYFSLKTSDTPSSVGSNESEKIGVRIQANSVPNDREGAGTIRVSGEFSNGKTCSVFSITDRFNVTILDSGSTRNQGNGTSDDTTGDADLTVSTTFTALKEKESKQVGIVVNNNTGSNECFTINAADTPSFTSELTKTSFCLDDGKSESLTMKITGVKSGNDTTDVRLSYAGKTKSKTITVGITGADSPSPGVSISAITDSQYIDDGVIKLVNNGTDLSNVRVRALSLPDNVKIESLSKDYWKAGEEIKLGVDTKDFEGKVSAILSVESSQGSKNIDVEFNSAKNQQNSGTGLFGVATNAGLGIGVLIVIVLAAFGLISLIRRK